ncbi:heat shock 70 kDa protein 12A-like [Dreissena polymorpha]|uniref:Uncharacterized protein n=1 Tax=Dreissena polymorpha TaxID=45954 RepID=A0A9D4K8R7_DREPO|nr:heat shock 70 kDa protein 12A-like [Dreissena polymorpha]KAH3835083.1 hypothetical protein DPMN_108422 [Dreissena polymorpha]
MESNWENKLIVASIDFGTTFTGCAFSMLADYQTYREKIMTIHWKSGVSEQATKTPTILLLKKDLSFESFGYEAEETFAEITEDSDDVDDWHYFKYFKMKLYDENKDSKIRTTSKVTDQNGREIDALHVISVSIKFIKDKIMDELKARIGVLRDDDVYFVLTCPAIWSDNAKRFMRTAAEKAGIANDHLRIGLEPECAAIYLHNVTLPDLSASKKQSFCMAHGDAYLIVDLGGGTVDIAAHKINGLGRFEEILIPDGGPWGSININFKFEQALTALSGARALETFRRENMHDYTALMRAFELKKIAFPGTRSKVTMQLPITYLQCHQNENRDSLLDSIKEVAHTVFSQCSFQPKNNVISFPNDSFASLYDETIGLILDKVRTILEYLEKVKQHDIKTIFCVGGFADCKLLRKRFTDEFGDRVIAPSEAITAIMKGAVMFGRDENIIEFRISRFTYGLDWSVDFDSKIHDPKRKEVTESGDVCKDIFYTIAEMGQRIPTDYATKKIESFVKASSQDRMEFPFYRTEKVQAPLYIDDPGCSLMGSMIVGLDDTAGGLDRYVTLEVYFGASELRAEATDNKGKKHTVAFNLDESEP